MRDDILKLKREILLSYIGVVVVWDRNMLHIDIIAKIKCLFNAL